MTEARKHVCILGGGFGGLYTALRLNELPWENSGKPKITLVDKSDRFLFSPLLYELLTGEMQAWEIAPSYSELLADTQVQFKQGSVKNIDLTQKRVKLEDGTELDYDRLVMGTGGNTPLDFVPGAQEYALPFRTLGDAMVLADKLKQLENSDAKYIRIVIAGGGYSGVELACKLADRLGNRGRIRIIERADQILRTSPEFNRDTAKKALEAKQVWLDLETEIQSIEAASITIAYKGKIDTIPVNLVLWTVGTRVSEFIAQLPLKHNNSGFLVTNSLLQVEGDPHIYALGDLADCQDATGQQVPKTAQAAIQQSDYCAWNIWASLTGRPPLAFRYQPLGEMMTLGINEATLTGLGLKLEGTTAYLARRLIYLYRLPTRKHQLTVGLNWLAQPLLELLKS
ncbi:NAD(P)/FAD-dependent oxidoreductase [Gloeocapsa sp. PCC 73106]|uniref:NAD(P)/FAD-dependent oxidoreductase n=1 Tax=Gloeocapsa sp. PCC 73106 TaxID=102232 RepID=UPI0002AC9F8A|nr:NAD(P)/FAD-dependent oxidoreductase [Gloeocapsa sp. PCC 73106]ELR98346.1 NADH dehydrogenase, FAD-containing subunit [Gloeocapsa sp. PCC 73106]